jgi:hypothetical protein
MEFLNYLFKLLMSTSHEMSFQHINVIDKSNGVHKVCLNFSNKSFLIIKKTTFVSIDPLNHSIKTKNRDKFFIKI